MSDIVEVRIPVDRKVADALEEPETQRLAVRIIQSFIRPRSPEDDPLALLIRQLKAEVPLTDAEVDAELEAYNRERRR